MADAKQTKQKKKQETSKGIVLAMLIIFAVSMTAAYVLPVLFEYIAETVQAVFQATTTLTGSVVLGYFGKAGFENYDKHKKQEGFVEGGNG